MAVEHFCLPKADVYVKLSHAHCESLNKLK